MWVGAGTWWAQIQQVCRLSCASPQPCASTAARHLPMGAASPPTIAGLTTGPLEGLQLDVCTGEERCEGIAAPPPRLQMLPSRHATAQLQHTACHAVPCPQPMALPLPAPTPLELAWCRSTCGVQHQSLAAARRCTALRMPAAAAARRRPCVSWRLTAQPLLPVPQEQRCMAASSFRRRVAPAGGGGGRVQQRSGDAWPLPALLSVVSERALAPSARRGDKPDPERRGARGAAGRGCQTVRSFPVSYQHN